MVVHTTLRDHVAHFSTWSAFRQTPEADLPRHSLLSGVLQRRARTHAVWRVCMCADGRSRLMAAYETTDAALPVTVHYPLTLVFASTEPAALS
jgi:hypothetical protein